MVFSLLFVLLSGHRVDTELSNLKTKLEGMSASSMSSNADYGNTSEETTLETIEVSQLIKLLLSINFIGNYETFCS